MSDIEDPVDDSKVTQGRHRCIVMGIVVVAALAIAAIVLPLVIEQDCNCTKDAPTPVPPGTPTSAPTKSPVFSETPTISLAPSEAPSSPRFKQFIEIFLYPISGEKPFEDPNSPQYRAAEFLAYEDQIGPDLENAGQLADRYALAVFYYAMDGDDSWKRCFQGDTECEDGVAWMDPMMNQCEWNSINCDEDGRVIDLFFSYIEGNGLKGSIPREIEVLERLQTFIAIKSRISGKFPNAMGKMKNITTIVLNENRMSGSIQDDFLIDSPVELFLVGDNNFSGEIPSSFGKITTLKQLGFANNDFSGSIPKELGEALNLETLDLSGNTRIRGAIPDEIYAMQNLENLQLNGCSNLQGTIEDKIEGMISLATLRLGGTKYSGELPDGIFELPNLRELDLTDANFTGELSEDFVQLADTLKILKLANNKFSGSVPSAFNDMTLSVVNLERNDLEGIIPLDLCLQTIPQGGGTLLELTVDCSEVSCSCCTNCE